MRLPLLLCLTLLAVSCGSDRDPGASDWRFAEEAPNAHTSPDEAMRTDDDAVDPADDAGPLSHHEFAPSSRADALSAVEEFCDAYAQIYCSYVWECLSPEQRAGVSSSLTQDHCRALYESTGCGLEVSAENGNIDVDAEGLRECIRAAQAGECFDVWACASKAVRPAVARGEACTTDWDCEDDDVCRYSVAETCAPRECGPLAQEGDYCAFSGECSAWLVCIDETCVAPGPEDTYCDAERPCDEGFECVMGSTGWGVCERFLYLGEPCGERRLRCDHREGYCDFTQQPGTPFCRPWAAPGQSCADADCDPGHYCSSATICEPLSAPGGACAEDGGCWYDHACIDGVCQLVGTIGTPCEYGSDCHEWLECLDGQCSYRRDDGEACNGFGECLFSSTCLDGVCVGYHDMCTSEH